jgi:phage-related holin
MKWVLAHIYNFISSLFIAILGYFAPIKGVFHLMVIAIIIDLITGVIASRKAGHGIKSLKLWRTIYKLVFAVVVVSLAFALDKELGIVKIHRFIAWLIIGFEIWSILENAGKITNHKIFRVLQHFMEDKVKDVTGVDLEEKQ